MSRRVFPAKPSTLADWGLGYVFKPSSGVSGDFYDSYEKTSSLFGVAIDMVFGSGMSSGLMTVLTKNLLNHGMQELKGVTLSATFVDINRKLVEGLLAAGNTVSCTIMRLGGTGIKYVNAAPAYCLVRRSGCPSASVIEPGYGQNKVIPPGSDDYDAGRGTTTFSMMQGDALPAFFAGVSGSVNTLNVSYGVEWLAEAFGRLDPENAESTLASVMIDFRNYVTGAKHPGDITAIVLIKR